MPKQSFAGSLTQSTSVPVMQAMGRVVSVRAVVGTFVLLLAVGMSAQSPQPYPNAATDRLIRLKTPMPPPPVNLTFTDPDFGSTMVRVTDQNFHFLHPGWFLRTEGSGTANMWSADTSKFYVVGQGGVTFAYSFSPSTMNIGSLPNASPGQALHVPLRAGGSFSFTDSDLMYGTTNTSPLKISSYRFSSGVTSTVVDTTTCGAQPPIIPGPKTVSDDDVTPSLDDGRISISEGGPFGADMYVIVYDKKLGCRWYNTQTGQIGGAWGPSGNATFTGSYLSYTYSPFIRHAYLSRSGNYVHISEDGSGWYVWDLATLNVRHCPLRSNLDCGGYSAVGYDDLVSSLGTIDGMNIGKRPLSDIAQFSQLVLPLPPPHYWGQEKHFTWSNVDINDSAPVCASSYLYKDDGNITQPFEGEIFCIETDGAASTVWRFAHNRATWYPKYFNTQPLGSISRDGRFFLFTSAWDEQLGTGSDGTPRSDVWIVKLK
jgi:hypothetical protein